MEKKKSGVSPRQWLIFIFVGLAGQFAWSIENMYLNSYLYYLNMNAPLGEGFNPSTMVAVTTALSAVTATLTTILMGAFSDRVRKRKIFVTLGYILWGIATASFGLLDFANADSLFPIAMTASFAAIMVIVIDCIMTFLGSTANDAAFNSYVTKTVKEEDRGKVEGVLSILPLVAMLIIFVGLNGLTVDGHWDLFFYVVGAIVTLVGIASIFLIPKEEKEEKRKTNFFKDLVEGFLPQTVKENKRLYVILLAYFIYATAIQVFFPYLMVYVERTSAVPNTGDSFLTPFAIVMALSLLLGSAGSVLIGFAADKKGKMRMAVPTILILALGLILMFFAPLVENDSFRYVYTSISGVVMILGYVAVPTILNSLVRDHIPEGKEGTFMGVRMVFVVALPMCIGPFIGDALNNSYGVSYVNEYGVESPYPSNWSYIVALFILLISFVPLVYLLRATRGEKNEGYLESELSPSTVPSIEREMIHPRPFLQRDEYILLDGKWDILIKKNEDIPSSFDMECNVPFAVETPLSGINHLLLKDEYIFYRKEVDLSSLKKKNHIYLCFEGVDQFADVFIDGELVFSHEGGYTRFRIDIADKVKNDKVEIIVRVKDVTDTSYLMTGKQRMKPNGWFYSSSSGIYRSVYIETAGMNPIEDFELVPDYDKKEVSVLVKTKKDTKILLSIGEEKFDIPSNTRTSVKIDSFHPWSIDDPYLYDVTIENEDDMIHSYLGFRKQEIRRGEDGKNHIYLNDKRVFINGLLDQGYYLGGGLTPNSYSVYEKDIDNVKRLGFNTLRVHVHVKEEIFYYLAAKKGILLIQDIPNGGEYIQFFNVVFPRINVNLFNHDKFLTKKKYGRDNKEGCKKFVSESLEIASDMRRYPSVFMITIFNEAWGEFDPDLLYTKHKENAPELLYDTASGWLDSENSDIFSVHTYTIPHRRRQRGERPYVLTEIGGASLKVKDHFIYPKVYGHHVCRSKEAFERRYSKLYEGFMDQIKDGSLNGIIYTQLSDCETEANGIYTLDREGLKISESILKSFNLRISDLIG